MIFILILFISGASTYDVASNYLIADIAVNEIPFFLQTQNCCNCSFVINRFFIEAVDSCNLYHLDGIYYLNSIKFSKFSNCSQLFPYILPFSKLFYDSPHGIVFSHASNKN